MTAPTKQGKPGPSHSLRSGHTPAPVGERDSDHIALLAHDLRTPLSAMLLTAELIGGEPLSTEQRSRLDILIRAINALSDMTNTLIDQGHKGDTRDKNRKDSPQQELSLTEGDPVNPLASSPLRIVQDIVELFRVAAERKGLILSLTHPQHLPPLAPSLPMMLRRILSALVDNAVKYTETGSIAVELAVLQEPKRLQLIVRDSGPGISPEERHRLFRPYVRGHAGNKGITGSGLGLWGVARMVQEVGGSLSLESPAAGGCTFEIVLPVTPKAVPEKASGSHPLGGLEEAYVLVVDDNDTNRRLLTALLESFGISSDEAASGPEAIARVKTTLYDAILLDLHMPGMDGLETAAALQNLENGFNVPLIAVTAAVESVADQRLKRAGFQDALAKPLAPTQLFKALELAREHHRKRTGETQI